MIDPNECTNTSQLQTARIMMAAVRDVVKKAVGLHEF
jgi:hypothetical protein